MVRVMQNAAGQMTVTIPSVIAKAKEIRKGQKMRWFIDELGRMYLIPVKE